MAQEVRSCSICSICSNALSEQQVCCLACGHVFHNSCIEGYLQTKDGCPYSCRFPENEPAIRKLYIDEDPAHNEGEAQNIALLISQQAEQITNLQKELALKDGKIDELTNETNYLNMTKSNLSRELHKLVAENKQRQDMDLVIKKSLEHQSNELELKIASLQSEKDDLMRQLEDKEENQAQTIAILTSEHESKIAALDRELNDKTRELSERESEVLHLNKSIGETGDFDEKAFTEHEEKELIAFDNFKSMFHSILVKSGNHTCELDDLADKSHSDWECNLPKFATDFVYSTIADLLKALPSVASIKDNRVNAVAKDEIQHDSEHVNMRDGSAEFILVCHSGSQDRDKAANLKITPSSIVFPAAKDVTATLNNQNPQLIQFRIIDTGNNISEYFKFVPFEGFVEPEKSVDIKVTCRKEPPSGYQIHVEYREAIVSVSNAKDW